MLVLFLLSATAGACIPDYAIELLKHELSIQREYHHDKGQPPHYIVSVVVFPEVTFAEVQGVPQSLHLRYWFTPDGSRSSFMCRDGEGWKNCATRSYRRSIQYYRSKMPRVRAFPAQACSLRIPHGAIPEWHPSPDSPEKRRITARVLREIESKWGPSSRVVVRDFNLNDSSISIYLEDRSGNPYVTHCAFRVRQEPMCEGWQGFGQASMDIAKDEIFALPLVLK